MRASFIFRIRIVALLVGLLGLLLVVRLYNIQIAHGSDYRDRAEGQYAALSAGAFDRGRIYFTPKEGPPIAAATIESGYTVALIPNQLTDPAATYAALSTFIALDRKEFMEKSSKRDDPHEELAHRVSPEVGQAIRNADIEGVGVYPEAWRLYPGAKTAAQTIGFLGYGTGDILTGQYGLERFYDEVLVKPDSGLYVNFFADIFAGIRTQLLAVGTGSGGDVVTAIEPSVQTFFENLLGRYNAEWRPEEVGAILMDPKTGALIAISTLPSFDPNNLREADSAAFSNRLVERVYEFGSIMKPLTLAAGIDAGVITPESTYNDRGYAVYDGSRINNWDLKGRGNGTSMQRVLSDSLNTGAAWVAVDKLGTDLFRSYFESYGLREETGIDLPNEAEPLTANLDSPRSIEYATASFGQGVAVSPIAMARALATLANHGLVPSPHVALELRYPGFPPKKLDWAPERRAISEKAAEAVTGMLVRVVDEALRGGTVKIPELSVAAKTGTAQIAKENERGYYDGRYLHSFFGYFPAYNAKFLVFFYAVAPQGAKYASETWTAPFMESVRFLVSYYDIPPDRVSTTPSP